MRVILALAVTLVAGLVIGLSCDKATEPEPTGPKEYPVYFADPNTHSAFVYDPLTGKVDSLPIHADTRDGMRVSPDGRTLYMSNYYSVVALDLVGMSFSTVLARRAKFGVVPSPDGRLLAALGDDLDIYDLESMSLIHHDTNEVLNGCFAIDSKRFHVVAKTGGGQLPHVYTVNLGSGNQVTRTFFSQRAPRVIVPDSDSSHWYLIQSVGMFLDRFEVYDVSADSIIFADDLVPGNGRIAVSPDGRYVFYTNVGPFLDIGQPDPPYTITVYDTETNQRVKEIRTVGVFGNDTLETEMAVFEVCCTPDGRWLVGIDNALTFGIITVDLETLEVARWDELERYSPFKQWLSCQSSL
ncbi:MAG: hypothetical protein JSU65_06955 [Candidatus Zixiibacteriota bacterium]|nr:MAG: hypothetical protein JSU65_06955 [candidate division Zixibacteria bacterium]